MKENGRKAGTKKSRTIVIALLIVAVVAVIIYIKLMGCGDQSQIAPNNTFTPIEAEKARSSIRSKYVEWVIPSECMAHLRYEQETKNNLTSDLFYMRIENEEVPIFRFDFGDEDAGDWLGVLKDGETEIPITFTVFVISDEELATLGENATEVYYMLMDTFNIMVQNLNNNSNFSAQKPMQIIEDKQDAVMTYWTVALPVGMDWYEIDENGTYQAFFYGNIHGERIPLYQVNIGGVIADDELGLYRIDDVYKVVSVRCYDVSERTDWSEEDYSVAYLMMDTINNVIETIMSSEQFSIPVEEPAVPEATQ